MIRDFESENGIMMIGGISAVEIANKYGTPVYVTDEQIVRKNYRKIYNAFSKHMETEVHYACKANTNLAILNILRQEGSYIDAVSIGEVLTCIKAGFSPDQIMYTGVSVSNNELQSLISTECKINIDSESELERLAKILGNDIEGFPISFRITPEVILGHNAKVMTEGRGSKFGIPLERVIPVYSKAKKLGFDVKGIHAHIDSESHSIEPFLDVVEVLVKLTNKIKEEIGIDLEFINFGGGFGVPYKLQEEECDVESIATEVTDMILENTDVKKICLEPGRYIVCDSTILLAKCTDVKDTGTKKYVGIDAGFNTLIRPAFYDSYHHVAIVNKFNKACTTKYDVIGPICETGDCIAHDRILPDPHEGDIVAIYCAGAYGFSMSSNYNSRPLCKEVLVNNGRSELIRESETIEDLWAHQIVPERLKK